MENTLAALRARTAILTNFAWAVAGNVTSSGCQWLIVVLLARIGTPDIVGQYTLALAVVSPVFLFASLNLRNIQSTDVVEPRPVATYLSIRLLTASVALALSLALAWWGYQSEGVRLTILAVALAKVVDAVVETIYGQLQQEERIEPISRSMMARSLLGLAVFGAVAAVTQSAPWAAVSLCLTSMAVLLAYDLWALRHPGESTGALLGRIRPHLAGLLRASLPILRVATPSGALLVLVSLNANLPRYFLAHYYSETEVGLLSAMFYLTVAANTTVMALGQSGSSRLARSYSARNGRGFLRMSLALLGLAGMLGAALTLAARFWGEPLLGAIYGPAYARHTDAFFWLMVGGSLSYVASACGYIMSSARYFLPQLPMLAATTLAMTAALWVLVPAGGLVGAAIAQAIGYLVQAILSLGLVVPLWLRLRGER